nr:MAG TPA: portal protein [Caudoviricetes sp.]
MFKFLRKNKGSPMTVTEFINNYGWGYREDGEKFLKELYKNPFTSAGITRINEALNNLKWSTYKKGRSDNVTEMKNTFVNRTLKKPSNILNIDQLINYFALYYMLFGELLVMRIDLFTKSELVLFKKGTYYIEYDNDNVLNGIKSIQINMKTYRGEELKQFFYIKGVNVYDNVAGAGFGISKMQSLSLLHDYYCYITKWNNNLLKNSGKRDIIALVKAFLNPQKRKELKDDIKSQSGAKAAGEVLILDGQDISIVNGDFSPREFDFLQALDEIRNITAAVMNVPSILIGDRTNSKFSNYKEAKKDLYTENIIPIAQQIAEHLNNIFADKLEANEYIDFDTSDIEVLKEDKNVKMERLNNISYLTINEKRAELEYPPVENGDIVLIDGSKTPLNEIFDEVKPEEEDRTEDEETDEENS